MGLVDAVVMAQAERHRARAIVTTDSRHFRAVRLAIDPPPRLVPSKTSATSVAAAEDSAVFAEVGP